MLSDACLPRSGRRHTQRGNALRSMKFDRHRGVGWLD